MTALGRWWAGAEHVRHRPHVLTTDAQVIVLGGGLSGCLVAAGLHDRGVDVAIVEQHPELMSAASRWNDGRDIIWATPSQGPPRVGRRS